MAMRKIILSELTTLDGVIEAPGGEPGIKYTGWSGEYKETEAHRDKSIQLGHDRGNLSTCRITTPWAS